MNQIGSDELRELYQRFFESKGHARIPSAPLTPENDPSVLFTTAGMHPLVPYLKGQEHPQGKRLTNVQKCLRTTDIDEVGDATHATVFEMLGNWSLGDYFKKEAIEWSWEFLTSKDWLGLDPNYLSVSVFAGDDNAPLDEESAQVWRQVGVAKERIAYLGAAENWWPAFAKASAGQSPPEGPQGPDTEMFYWTGTEKPPEKFDPEDERWIEIWNDVFMQFNRTEDGKLDDLPQKNVDTGMGVERVVMVLNGKSSIYEIDTFGKLTQLISRHAEKADTQHMRIVADHIKAATFVLGDKHPVNPSNTDRGYVLRRLIRRAVRSARSLGIADITAVLTEGQEIMTEVYGAHYPSLREREKTTRQALVEEIAKFEAVLIQGLKNFDKFSEGKLKGGVLAGEDAFRLYESYGFPIELTAELAKERGIAVDMGGFEEALKSHQAKSREGAKQKFAGGLADHSEESVRYHTATHLLHQALRDVLGEHVLQKGSNITKDRLRFDFSHPDRMTADELQRVQALVNEKIKANLPVRREDMTVRDAKKQGALGLFEAKYGDKVSVYSIGGYSKEICGGPHVDATEELGRFVVKKEESAGAGVRRIKAVLE